MTRKTVDSHGDRKDAQWSLGTWLFYIGCILAIALAAQSKAETTGWWSGTLGQGDDFFSSPRDSRWADIVDRPMTIPAGSAWVLEVRSRAFVPQANLRIKNVQPDAALNLGRISYHTEPGGLNISTRCFSRNPGSPGNVTATVQPWITSKEYRSPQGGTPGGQYFFRIVKTDPSHCPPPQGHPRITSTPTPQAGFGATLQPVANQRCPTWGEIGKTWNQFDAAFSGLRLFAGRDKVYYAFGRGIGENTEATGMYYQVPHGWEVRNCQTGAEKRMELKPPPNPTESADGQWTIWHFANRATLKVRNNSR